MKVIKSNASLFGNNIFLFRNFNYCLEKAEFSFVLKYTVAVPVHYKKEWIDQANCWPVSILPNLFKSFEKLVYHQYTINLVIFFHQNNVVSVKVTVFHIALWLRQRNLKNQGMKGTNLGLYWLTILTLLIA